MTLGSFFDDAERFTTTLFQQTRKGLGKYVKPLSEANLSIDEVLDHAGEEIADAWAYHQEIRRQVAKMQERIAELEALNNELLEAALTPEQSKRVRLRPMSEAPEGEVISIIWLSPSGVMAWAGTKDRKSHNIGWLPYSEFCALFLTPDGEEVRP